ncbi:MAG: hypothetical protein ACKVJK_22710 [Methylophagaceae bacterium]|jgi:hypothetical protein|tara:strand:- start:904 stop:1371 length:468 start_codon:yes stop_codon:yes gene_type:complete
MAAEKLAIKEILSWIDNGQSDIWNHLEDDHKKQISFWLLNRYVASVQGSREKQELAIFKTNEYYNKHFNIIGVGKDNGHQKLMWQLLCMSGNTGKNEFHPWIGFKKKTGDNNKGVKLIEQLHPNMKQNEVEILASLYTKKELKQLAEEHNIDIKL